MGIFACTPSWTRARGLDGTGGRRARTSRRLTQAAAVCRIGATLRQLLAVFHDGSSARRSGYKHVAITLTDNAGATGTWKCTSENRGATACRRTATCRCISADGLCSAGARPAAGAHDTTSSRCTAKGVTSDAGGTAIARVPAATTIAAKQPKRHGNTREKWHNAHTRVDSTLHATVYWPQMGHNSRNSSGVCTPQLCHYLVLCSMTCCASH